jgi:hypothetical protein
MKKTVSEPTNCDKIISESFSVGFTWMKLSAVFYKTLHYSSQTSVERNLLRGRKCCGWEEKGVCPSPPRTGYICEKITQFPSPSLCILPSPNSKALGTMVIVVHQRDCKIPCVLLTWMGTQELASKVLSTQLRTVFSMTFYLHYSKSVFIRAYVHK